MSTYVRSNADYSRELLDFPPSTAPPVILVCMICRIGCNCFCDYIQHCNIHHTLVHDYAYLTSSLGVLGGLSKYDIKYIAIDPDTINLWEQTKFGINIRNMSCAVLSDLRFLRYHPYEQVVTICHHCNEVFACTHPTERPSCPPYSYLRLQAYDRKILCPFCSDMTAFHMLQDTVSHINNVHKAELFPMTQYPYK